MKIIRLFLRLDDEARKEGGRVLGLLGNHELMNIDKDFRYVSPLEFLEFVPEKMDKQIYRGWLSFRLLPSHKGVSKRWNDCKHIRSKKEINYGYWKFSFCPWRIDADLILAKYSIAGINQVVSKWLSKESNQIEDKIFDEIFRDDDDMSPFWCRIYGEDDEENTEETFNELLHIMNQKNKLLMPVKGMVIAHTPQFMDSKYLNSIYNNRLWRIDVGMSLLFGNIMYVVMINIVKSKS